MRQPYVHEMFEQVAARQPQALAMAGGDRTLTYAQLNAWSSALANKLAQFNGRERRFVYVAAGNSFSMVASILGALKAGSVFVPLNPAEPSASLLRKIGQLEPGVAVADTDLIGRVNELFGSTTPVIDIATTLPGKADHVPAPDAVALAESGPDDLCYIYFTSGSTGKPKPVAGRLKSIDHFVRWEIETFDIRPGTAVSQLTSPVFDAFLRDMFVPLCAGGTMQVPPDPRVVLDARSLAQWLSDTRIELVHTVPSLFRTLLAQSTDSSLFPALKHILLAGEPLLPSDVKRWMSLFGERISLVNLYGPTETTMVKLFHRVRPADAERRAIPIGQAMPGARVLTLDENGRVAADGMIGEVYIRTPYRTLGYYNDPALTGEVFVQNPLNPDDPSDIVYRTGDLARLLEDGNLEFVGRNDRQLKIRGVRVEPAEVENAILATGLAEEIAVISRADHVGNSYLAAYYVSNALETGERLRAALSTVVPAYLVPSSFTRIEGMPRTATGKIDRIALASREESQNAGALDFVAPRTATENETARLFAEAHGLASVGIKDNFFQMGGHSLLAMSLLANLSSRFDISLPLALLFQFPTVEQIAAEIDQALADKAAEAPPPQPDHQASAHEAVSSNIENLTEAEIGELITEILRTD